MRVLLAILVAISLVGLSKMPIAQAQPAAASAQADFEKMFGQYKELLARLRQLRDRYAQDRNADKTALETEYNEKLAQAQDLNVKLAAAAEAAYRANPNDSGDAAEFVFTTMYSAVEMDEFEQAARLAKLLDENDYKRKGFHNYAGLAYYAANDFDKAAEHFAIATTDNELTPLAQRLAPTVEGERAKWKKESEVRAAEDAADDLPKVKLSTTKGDIVILLFENEAPIATNNFVSLVEKKYYDGLKFHRVIPNFMAQGGDPKGDGTGGPGYFIPDECRNEKHRNHFRGSLSMAKSAEPDTGGSQFFLNFTPTPHLDGQHTVFGRVIEGQDVLAKLQRTEPGKPGMPGAPDKINKATVLRKRNHVYEPSVKKPEKK